MSHKGCASFFVIALIGLWTAVMGGLMAVGWLGSGLIEFFAHALFGDTPDAQGIIDGTTSFVRGTAGGFLGLIWGLGMAILILLWIAAYRSASVRISAERVVWRREAELESGPHEMKDVTPPKNTLPPARGGDLPPR